MWRGGGGGEGGGLYPGDWQRRQRGWPSERTVRSPSGNIAPETFGTQRLVHVHTCIIAKLYIYM